MSGLRRSKLAALRSWLRRRQHADPASFGPPPWLRAWRDARRVLSGAADRWMSRLTPRWLRNSMPSARGGLRRIRSSIGATRHRLGRTISQSALGAGARHVSRLGKLVRWRLVALVATVLRRAGEILSTIVPVPLRRRLARASSMLARHLGVVSEFLGRWCHTRQYLQLIGGIPAVLLSLPLLYCAVRLPFYGSAAKAQSYRRAAEAALLARDRTTADLYHRKLTQLGAMNEWVEFQAACQAYEAGEQIDSIAVIRRLAPDSEPGFVPAHVWLARWYLEGKSELSADQARDRAEEHLQHALRREPKHPAARSLRSYQRQRGGHWDDAIRDMETVVRQVPEQGLSLAQLYVSQGRWQAAAYEARKVVSLLAAKSHSAAALTAQEYGLWSAAHLFLGQTEAAEQVLQTGLRQYPQDQRLRDHVYDLCLSQASRSRVQSVQSPAKIVQWLTQACQLHPDRDEPLLLLGQLSAADSRLGQQARTTLDQLAAATPPPPRLHAVMGSIAYARGDPVGARMHLEQACQQNPQDAQSLNNLAVLLDTEPPVDQVRALELVTAALAFDPRNTMYRETRGQILLRLQRYAEAVTDLEYALNGLGDQPKIHAALATAYDKLGQVEVARMHRQLADGR